MEQLPINVTVFCCNIYGDTHWQDLHYILLQIHYFKLFQIKELRNFPVPHSGKFDGNMNICTNQADNASYTFFLLYKRTQ